MAYGAVSVTLRHDVPNTGLLLLKSRRPDILKFKVSFKSLNKFICCLSRSPIIPFVDLFNFVSVTLVNNIDDCNFQKEDWVVSMKIRQGRPARSYTASNTFFSRVSSLNVVDALLTIHVEYYINTSIHPRIWRSDHALSSVFAFADVEL